MESDSGSITSKIKAFIIQNPVDRYISQAKSDNLHSPRIKSGERVRIPLNRFSEIMYRNENEKWWTNRDSTMYDIMVFSDEYQEIPRLSQDLPRLSSIRDDSSEIIAGGRDKAFSAGKTVLDLGSGEAIALLEYSKLYPRTVFIGIDQGYSHKSNLDLNRTGVQLTKEDWNILSSIPTGSIDTIISCQGGLEWGFKQHEDANHILGTLTRVMKLDGILRFDIDMSQEADKNKISQIEQHGWKVVLAPGTAVAIKQ
jgi:hypothetical protein